MLNGGEEAQDIEQLLREANAVDELELPNWSSAIAWRWRAERTLNCDAKPDEVWHSVKDRAKLEHRGPRSTSDFDGSGAGDDVRYVRDGLEGGASRIKPQCIKQMKAA